MAVYIKFDEGESANQIQLTLMHDTENGLLEVSEENDDELNLLNMYASVVLTVITKDSGVREFIEKVLADTISALTTEDKGQTNETEDTDDAVLDSSS
jgi:hypothetical protein